MIVRETKYSSDYLPLLLLADPDEKAIKEYVYRSRIFVCEENEYVVGIAAVTKENGNTYEIKNIAVLNEFHRCGIGKKLIATIKTNFKGSRLVVGTADTSTNAQKFYESCGFKKFHTIKDFFITNYQTKVFENGLQCKDMIMFQIEECTDKEE